jgi:hypothetical protein
MMTMKEMRGWAIWTRMNCITKVRSGRLLKGYCFDKASKAKSRDVYNSSFSCKGQIRGECMIQRCRYPLQSLSV